MCVCVCTHARTHARVCVCAHQPHSGYVNFSPLTEIGCNKPQRPNCLAKKYRYSQRSETMEVSLASKREQKEPPTKPPLSVCLSHTKPFATTRAVYDLRNCSSATLKAFQSQRRHNCRVFLCVTTSGSQLMLTNASSSFAFVAITLPAMLLRVRVPLTGRIRSNKT